MRVVDRLERSAVLSHLARSVERYCRGRPPQGGLRAAAPIREAAAQAVRERLAQVRALEPFVDQPERVAELHALRIAVKRLRYTLEALRPVHIESVEAALKALRRLQTLLGDIHDDDVWQEFLPRFLEEEHQRTLEFQGHTRGFARILPGVEAFHRERRATRQRRYREFVDLWRAPATLRVFKRLDSGALLRPLDQEMPL
jgi:CHAD domain-containing protein